MLHRALVPATVLVLSAAACGDTSSDTGAGGSGTTSGTEPTTVTETDENSAPSWADAPSGPVSIGEGQTLALPADIEDADGDAVEVTFTTPPGIEAEIDTELTSVTLHAGYGIAGAHEVEVTLADGKGSTTVKVAVEVKPLAWLTRTLWSEAEGPEAREHGSLVFVPPSQFVMFGGTGYSPYGETFADAWSYAIDTATWTALTPEGAVPDGGGSRRVATTGEPGVAYLFGGYGVNGATNRDLFRLTVNGASLSFEELTHVNAPPRRALHAFVYDAAGDRFVTFGGFGTKVLGDTWIATIDGTTATWTELTTPVAPSPRYGFFYGFDSVARRLVVWSGAQGANPIDPAGDVWALDLSVEPPVWSMLLDADAPGAPPGRRNGCFVFDPSGPRLAVFGGTADAMTSEEGLWMLDARPGRERWDRLELAEEPPIRSSGFGLPDAQGTLWMGFGNTTSAVFRDFNALGYAD